MEDSFSNITIQAVESGLKEGDYLLLLDALDEIPTTELRREVIERIYDAIIKYRSSMVITTRISLYEHRLPSRQKLRCHVNEYILLPLRKERIEEYVRKCFQDRPSRVEKKLLNAIDDENEQHLRELLSNPLHLEMMTNLAHSPQEEEDFIIPNQRTDLYNNFIKHILEDRPQIRKSKHLLAHRAHLARNYLDTIAFCFLDRLLPGAVEADLRYFMEKTYQEFLREKETETPYPQPSFKRRETPKDHLDYLVDEAELLQKFGNLDRYEFKHISYQEFFAAEYLVRMTCDVMQDESIQQNIKKNLLKPQWQEVIVFYYAQAPQKGSWLLHHLLREKESLSAAHLFLTVKCLLATSRDQRQRNKKRVLERLVTYYNESPYEAVRSKLSQALYQIDEAFLVSFLRQELTRGGTPSCRRALEALRQLKDMRDDVRVGLLSLVQKDRERNDKELTLLATDILLTISTEQSRAVLLNWLNDPSIIRDIVYRLLNSPSRDSFMQALLEYIEQPEIAEWLRDSIIEELGEHAHPETNALFLRWLQEKRDDTAQLIRVLDAIHFEAPEITRHVAPFLETPSNQDVEYLQAVIRFLGRQAFLGQPLKSERINQLFDLFEYHKHNISWQEDILVTLVKSDSQEAIVALELLNDQLSPKQCELVLGKFRDFGKEVAFRHLENLLSTAQREDLIIGALYEIRKRLPSITMSVEQCGKVLDYLKRLNVSGLERKEDLKQRLCNTAQAIAGLLLRFGTPEQKVMLLTFAQQDLHTRLAHEIVNYQFKEGIHSLEEQGESTYMQELRTFLLHYKHANENTKAAFQIEVSLSSKEKRAEILRNVLYQQNADIAIESLNQLYHPDDGNEKQLEILHAMLQEPSLDLEVTERVIEIIKEYNDVSSITPLYRFLLTHRGHQTAFETLSVLMEHSALSWDEVEREEGRW